MYKQQLSAEVYYEFRKLSRGIELSYRSSFKISGFFLRKLKKIVLESFWLFVEPPKLWKKIGPDRSEEFHSQIEYRPYVHPPSLWF